MSWYRKMAGDEPTVDNIEIYLSPMWHYYCGREFIESLYFIVKWVLSSIQVAQAKRMSPAAEI